MGDKEEAEEVCGASPVMEAMVDRLYYAENNLESNFKRAAAERDKTEEFGNSSNNYFKENRKLPEWYIRYKLGQKLTFGYNLIHIEDGKYEEEKNYSVGYEGSIHRLNHWRFGRDAQERDIEAEKYLKKTFNNYFFDKKVCIYSHKGQLWFKIVDENLTENIGDPWYDDDDGWVGVAHGSTEIINLILSEIHKQVFIRVGYKKKKESRLIGKFRNGNPCFQNFMIDDLTKPIYKFA